MAVKLIKNNNKKKQNALKQGWRKNYITRTAGASVYQSKLICERFICVVRRYIFLTQVILPPFARDKYFMNQNFQYIANHQKTIDSYTWNINSH